MRPLDGGAALGDLIAQMRVEMPGGSVDAEAIAKPLAAGIAAVEAATAWLIDRAHDRPAEVAGGATPFLQMVGVVASGWLLARGATAAAERIAAAQIGGHVNDAGFLRSKILVARSYAEQILSAAPSIPLAVQGWVTLMAIDPRYDLMDASRPRLAGRLNDVSSPGLAFLRRYTRPAPGSWRIVYRRRTTRTRWLTELRPRPCNLATATICAAMKHRLRRSLPPMTFGLTRRVARL